MNSLIKCTCSICGKTHVEPKTVAGEKVLVKWAQTHQWACLKEIAKKGKRLK